MRRRHRSRNVDVPDAPGGPAARARHLPEVRHGPRAGVARASTRVEYTCPMHPEIVREPPGELPDLRHGPRAAHGRARRGENPELADMTRRFWVERRAHRAAVRAGDGRMAATGCSRPSVRPALGPARPRDAGRSSGAAGPSSSAAGRRCVNRSLNMFTLIALGHRRRLRLQRRRDPAPRASSRPSFRGHGGPRRSTSRRRPSSSTLVLLGQVLELRARSQHRRRHPRAARPRAEDRAARRGRRRRGGRAARAGAGRATGCASGPARRSRSTASCSRARAPSTSRWSPASRSRSRRRAGDRGHRRHGQRHRQPS